VYKSPYTVRSNTSVVFGKLNGLLCHTVVLAKKQQKERMVVLPFDGNGNNGVLCGSFYIGARLHLL
jgi:hypothetical protein